MEEFHKKNLTQWKKLGLDVSYLDKDGDGKVDKDIKARANSVFSGDEERVYCIDSTEDGKQTIFSSSIVKRGDREIMSPWKKEADVSSSQVAEFYEATEE